MTSAYAFMDYCAQGQTIPYVVVDIAKPPSGHLTPVNMYVALSRSSGQQTICLLREFDATTLQQPIDPELEAEDKHLENLNEITKRWWEHMQQKTIHIPVVSA